ISSDSAVAGIIAQELREGQLPPPIYAPGFPYEGTLKAQLTALLGRAMPGVGTPLLYAIGSHLFYLMWTVAVMLLARAAGGARAGWPEVSPASWREAIRCGPGMPRTAGRRSISFGGAARSRRSGSPAFPSGSCRR